MNKRILFCADGYAVHTQEWLRLLEGTDWDVHVSVGGGVPPCPIDATFHTLDAKAENPAGNRARPFWPWRRGAGRVCILRFGRGPDAESKRFAALIRKLRPTIVHSLRLQNEGYCVLGALPAVRQTAAKWIVSLWGSDLCYFGDDPDHRARIEAVMRTCDYITADCVRDLHLSRQLGASAEQLYFDHAIPGNGGLDIEAIRRRIREPDPAQRRIVLIPKAREDRFHRFAPVVDALRFAAPALDGFSLVFLGANQASREQIARLPSELQRRCEVYSTVPREQVLDWMARSRVMVAPSLSDGTPNVMLEAMAIGALPILSPLASIREWLEDGNNGLLESNENAPQLARAITRACSDDALVQQAAERNLEIVTHRADRHHVRTKILAMYDRIDQAAVGPRLAEKGVRPARFCTAG